MSSDPCGSFSVPLRMVFDLTSRCNLRCAYCCFFSNPDECSSSDMPVEGWVALVEEAGRCGVLDLTLRGGEALLSPAFRPVVEAAVRNRMRFSLLTNGKLFTDETARWIASTGRCNMVKISLDGPENIHDPARGAGSHAAALAAIAAARAAGLPLRVTCAVHRYNWRKLPEIIEYLIGDLGLTGVSFSAVTVCDSEEYALSEEDFRDAVELLGKNERPGMVKAGMYAGLIRWRKLFSGEPECVDCPVLRAGIGVLSDGTFVPCPSLSDCPLGHAGRDSIVDAWNKLKSLPEILKFDFPAPDCASCRYSGACRGSCAGVRRSGGIWSYFCLRRYIDSGRRLGA